MADKKLIVVGLDCLEPSFAFEQWADSMPNLSRLRKNGSFARMRSSVPPITIPAWQCMVTGKDPGVLGFYGFRNRKDYSYDSFTFADGKAIKELRVWDYLSRAGKKNIVLGVPQTFPPRPLNGVMVSGFPLPGIEENYTYPATLKDEIKTVCDYIPDVEEFRTDSKEQILAQLIEMAKRRFKLAAHLLKNKPWDFFMMVEMGTDRIVHLLWRFTDPAHRHYQKNHPLNSAMRDYYALCDKLMGELIAPYEKEAAIMVVSDHGARGMDGGVHLNEWLIDKGYLTLKERPKEQQGLSKLIKAGQVDWAKTKVWAEGGYYSRIMFNIEGREPQGILKKSELDAFTTKLSDEFKAIPDETGRKMLTHVFKPHETYKKVNNIPPDLIVIFDDLKWRALGSIRPQQGLPLHVFENDTGPDDSNHNWHGVWTGTGGGLPQKGELDHIAIYDFAPTVLKYFGLEQPADMYGKAAV
ncbi:MAG: alkaline phosphatase family protein [Planctomycetes bacterium]|nr:alkaline phosphatase family protein [Planctomycetota bacterium]